MAAFDHLAPSLDRSAGASAMERSETERSAIGPTGTEPAAGRIWPLLFSWRLLRATFRACWLLLVHRRSLDAGIFLATLLEGLGPTFIKLGQILSCRPDLLRPGITNPLRRLQDRVAPIDPRLLIPLVEDALGMPLGRAFLCFDTVPVSSASIAQVHRAVLPTGEVVAVKIRRPGLCRTIETDLIALLAGARCLERIPFFRHIPMRETVHDFAGIIRAQLDFETEAANNRRFRRNFARRADVRFPRVVEELSGNGILTMEYLDGLRSVNDLAPSSETAHLVANLTLGALFQMIFEDGFVHADLHPGNVFLLGHDTLGLVDTGLVAQLDAPNRRNFASFFFGMVSNNGRECARILNQTAIFRAPEFRLNDFEADVVLLVSLHSGKNAREFNVTRFAAQLFALLRRHKLRASTSFMTTILALVVFEGIAKQIDPELDFQAEARRYIPLVLRALFGPAGRAQSAATA